MKVWTGVFMAGIGFTVGLFCGLLIHLPTDSMPTNAFEVNHLSQFRRLAHNDIEVERQQLALDRKQHGVHAYVVESKTRSKHVDLISVDHASLVHDINNMVANGDTSNKYVGVTREHQNSVVYVNPAQQKLVLDNDNFNETKQFRKARVAEYGLDSQDLSNKQVVDLKDYPVADANFNSMEIPDYSREFLSSSKDVIEGVYWGDIVERYCPKGFSKADYESWKIQASNDNYVSMSDGCGRMQNRLLTFQSSEKACARYRLNTDQIQGEIYSFYLNKLLGINNVVPSVLQLADCNKQQWRMVAQDVANAKWSEEKPVILAKWIDGLSPAYIPAEFRNLSKVLQPKDVIEKVRQQGNRLEKVNNGTSLCELVQWSDLIVFDYLTANLDRVVNNLFNLQWNDRMMSKPAHNLEKGPQGNLVFLDNESGLFHGYRLLDKYSSFHEDLLNSLCVFRKQTIQSISHFVTTDSIGDALHSLFEENEPLHRHLPRIPAANVKILKGRMEGVLRQVNKCVYENV